MTLATATVLRSPAGEPPTPSAAVTDLLGVLRHRLGVDAAWIGRVEADQMIIQALNGNGTSFGLVRGVAVRRSGSLYGRVLDGALPPLIPDTYNDPRTADLAIVHQLGIGFYAAEPVIDGTGRIHSMLGCLAHDARPWLGDRDSRFLRMLAAMLSGPLTDLHRTWEVRSRVWADISRVLDRGGPELVYQPVFDLADGHMVGVEALSRFPGRTSPAGWFAAAAAVGLDTELELAAIRGALATLPRLPAPLHMAVNASGSTVSAGLVEAVRGCDAERLIIEITEHDRIEDTPTVTHALDELRRLGVRLAADDVGSGYAGLEQLVRLRPDIIKMDCVLTRHIDTDPARRAVAIGLANVAREIGGDVVAEGIETPAELRAVHSAGIAYGQGFLLARPARCLSYSALSR